MQKSQCIKDMGLSKMIVYKNEKKLVLRDVLIDVPESECAKYSKEKRKYIFIGTSRWTLEKY